MLAPLGELRSLMDVQIGSGAIYVTGQMFIFGAATFVADSTSHLGQIENFATGRFIRFGNPKHTVDSSGGWFSRVWRHA